MQQSTSSQRTRPVFPSPAKRKTIDSSPTVGLLAPQTQYYASRISPRMAKTAEGFLLCFDAPISRAGVFQYAPHELGITSNRTLVDVERPAEEVFSPRSMASFAAKDVTSGHPNFFVNSSTFSGVSRGHVQDVRRSGDLLLATLVVKDENLISLVENGSVRGLSCGYNFDLLHAACGLPPAECDCDNTDDGKYRMKNILGNHVAIVKDPRGGKSLLIGDSANRRATDSAAKPKTRAQKIQDMIAAIDSVVPPAKTGKRRTTDDFGGPIETNEKINAEALRRAGIIEAAKRKATDTDTFAERNAAEAKVSSMTPVGFEPGPPPKAPAGMIPSERSLRIYNEEVARMTKIMRGQQPVRNTSRANGPDFTDPDTDLVESRTINPLRQAVDSNARYEMSLQVGGARMRGQRLRATDTAMATIAAKLEGSPSAPLPPAAQKHGEFKDLEDPGPEIKSAPYFTIKRNQTDEDFEKDCQAAGEKMRAAFAR